MDNRSRLFGIPYVRGAAAQGWSSRQRPRWALALGSRLLLAGWLTLGLPQETQAHGGIVHEEPPTPQTYTGPSNNFLLSSPLFPVGASPLTTRGTHEIWLSDQANTAGISQATPNGTHGGRIVIYDSANLLGSHPINNPLILDVTADLFPNALQTTQAHVARMHGILPSPDSRYMAVNFVASGHLGIVDGQTKKSLCLFRTTGTSTGRQNHMSFWTADGNHIVVANQNGRILERVDVVRDGSGAISEFVFNANASIDLVGGVGRITAQPIAVDMDAESGVGCRVNGVVADNQPTVTPSNIPKQSLPFRSLNTVICPVPSSTGKHVFATLGGGGMFVIDSEATPMAIVGEYDLGVVNAAGCGGAESQGYMHLATGTPGPGISEFTVYRFGIDYPSSPNFNSPNSPAPIAVWKDAQNGQTLPGNNRDAHGMLVAGDELHVFDRVRNNVEVFLLGEPWTSLAPATSYDLTTSGACGTTTGATRSNDPTPDLASIAPEGDSIYVALRGPYPLTVSHAAEGSCPGLGIIRRDPASNNWGLAHVLPLSVSDFTGLKNLSDPHAVVVRLNTLSEVPTPLPILGVGALLTVSRRLRQRR